MDFQMVFTLFSFLVGISIGSFLNVCIYRIPLGKSIIHPPSACPDCGRTIRFYDNIPLLSYLFLLGKCRNCSRSIPLRYPVVEFLTGLLGLALYLRYGLSAEGVLYFFFVAALVAVAFIDLDHKIIPDVISLPGILAGLLVSPFLASITWWESLIGVIAGGGSLFLVAFLYERATGREGMGGGDIKLLAMIGGWMGWKALPLILFMSSLSGTLIGGAALLLSGEGYRKRIPFGPFLSLGTLVYFFFGPQLIHWYSRLLWQ
jgi:leader peptidase (prepilin peptidase) / N-methyltransferase